MTRRDPAVAVIGAGMSGLCLAIALLRSGITGVTIYEKADEVGGTSATTPSRVWSATSPRASTSTASPGIPTGRTCSHPAARSRPISATAPTPTRCATGSASATGVLRHPRLPSIPGLDAFGGNVFHSARWTTASTCGRVTSRAYQTVALSGFPNFFMMLGPHSPVGNLALTTVAESQAGHIVGWIERWRRREFGTVEPTAAAAERFNAKLRAAMPDTAWTTGCNSWYLNKDGVPEVWPLTPGEHRRMPAHPDPAQDDLRPSVAAG